QTLPAMLPWPDTQDKISTYSARESVAEITELLARAGESIQVWWSDQAMLRCAFQLDAEFFIDVPTPQLRVILNAVKTQILDWSLNLERDGITGQGISFSDTEKKKATSHAGQLTPPAVYAFIQTMKVDTLNQTNNNSRDVNNGIQ